MASIHSSEYYTSFFLSLPFSVSFDVLKVVHLQVNYQLSKKGVEGQRSLCKNSDPLLPGLSQNADPLHQCQTRHLPLHLLQTDRCYHHCLQKEIGQHEFISNILYSIQ